MEAYLNKNKRNIKKKIRGHLPPSPALNRVNKKNISSRQPRRVKFDMEAYMNPTKRNMKKKI